jgi:hypothetical protein
MIEITVRCGCSRTMRADAVGPGRYRCGCGAQVALSGLPKVDDRHCALPKGNRICNGPKLADAMACEPCSVLIAKEVLADKEAVEQLGTNAGATAYRTARKAELDRLLALREDLVRIDRSPDAPKCGVVYYAELRPGILKIGTTLNLRTRMSTLHVPPASVVAAEPGTYDVEKARHQQFAHLRIGRGEDFRVDEGLREHVEALAAEHGDPFDLATRLTRQAEELASRASQS